MLIQKKKTTFFFNPQSNPNYTFKRPRIKKKYPSGLPGGPMVKNSPGEAGDAGSIPAAEDPTRCRATEPMCRSHRPPAPPAGFTTATAEA